MNFDEPQEACYCPKYAFAHLKEESCPWPPPLGKDLSDRLLAGTCGPLQDLRISDGERASPMKFWVIVDADGDITDAHRHGLFGKFARLYASEADALADLPEVPESYREYHSYAVRQVEVAFV